MSFRAAIKLKQIAKNRMYFRNVLGRACCEITLIDLDLKVVAIVFPNALKPSHKTSSNRAIE